MTPDALLAFWFGPPADDAALFQRNMGRWFGGGPAFDEEIRAQFSELLEPGAVMAVAGWAKTPEGRLAAILAFDQFSRNMFRGTPRAFALDPWARGLAREAVERRVDTKLSHAQRMFVYLPFEHSEDPEDQALSVQLYTAMRDGAPKGLHSALDNLVNYAKRHAEIVERFGRFPHRNAILGRESTAEEVAFLQTPGSSF
jgi:uncharacterized protein (DUF924 family)